MINPSALLKISGALKTFESEHPKFSAFFKAVFSRNMLEEGSVIEITVKKPDGTALTGNMKVTASDLELLYQLRDLA